LGKIKQKTQVHLFHYIETSWDIRTKISIYESEL